MPLLTRLSVRLALLYLTLGATLGALLLIHKGLTIMPWAWSLLPVHIEVMFIGWMTQFALGMAFWILPRFSGRQPRGEERWNWAAFVFLNLGLGFTCLASLGVLRAPLWIGRGLQGLGLLCFLIGNWRRVYPFAKGSPLPQGG